MGGQKIKHDGLMESLVSDIDFWLRVVEFLSPAEAARIARISSVVRRAVVHSAKYTRPKKNVPDHLALSRANCRHVQKAFDAGIRSFSLSALKIPVGVWYYRTLVLLGSLPIRKIVIDVLAIHYREDDNIKHDCLVARSLATLCYPAMLQSLVVKLCCDAQNSYPTTAMTHLEELRTIGLCARAMITILPQTIRVLEATVSGSMLVHMLGLPCLETAILKVYGPVDCGDVRSTPSLRTLVLRTKENIHLSIHAVGLHNLKLCVWKARVIITGVQQLHTVVVTGHVWPVRRVCLDLGGARVHNMRLHNKDLCNVLNAKPECLTIETFNDTTDIAPGDTIETTSGCQIQVQVYGPRRPVFARNFTNRLEHNGLKLLLERAVIREHLAIYLYQVNRK